MQVYTLPEYHESAILPQKQEEQDCFVIGNSTECEQLAQHFGWKHVLQASADHAASHICFETHETYDFLRLPLLSISGQKLQFSALSIYFGTNYLVIILSEYRKEESDFLRFLNQQKQDSFSRPSLGLLYYSVLHVVLNMLLQTLFRYEDVLESVEDNLLKQHTDYEFEDIVAIKNDASRLKRVMRLLLYVGDQLMLNDNALIPEKYMRYFRNIDMRLNRLYEYAINLCEIGTHLMDLYNTAATARTNYLLNRLTIFTAFATPITVITGLYGMNFINMPELRHPYGYFIVLGIILISVAVTYFILKKKKLL